MGEKVAQEDRQLLGKALSLYKQMTDNNDDDTAEKVKELGRKMMKGEFSIAFCGHFSAGKSSMINRLIGESILPASPIPTSANLVRITSGAEYAKVFFKNGGTILYPAPYDYEIVKSYCKDGDQIEAIEISHEGAEFLEDAVIMDTPGIDSTDDAHRIATESALHLSDMVFYVMDYNHVQSELNFLFTKELTDAGKDLYLVINQIDKHQDSELSFSQFKESVEAAFNAWGVRQSGIFYTSLKNKDFPQNQFEDLRSFIIDCKTRRKELLPVSMLRSMEKLGEDHLSLIQQNMQGMIEEKEAILEGIPETEREKLESRLDEITGKKARLMKENNPEGQFVDGINNILRNAYLMPFQTRELAEAYLESRQPGFKVGLLFSKQKTEAERDNRLEQFYRDLAEKVEVQLDWHIKDFLTKLAAKHEINDPELLKAIQAFKIVFDSEMLSETVKTGARLSGDYVLNYTEDVANSLKTNALKSLQQIKNQFINHASLKAVEKISSVASDEARIKELYSAWADLFAFNQELEEQRRKIADILYGGWSYDHAEEDLQLFAKKEDDPEVISSPITDHVQERNVEQPLKQSAEKSVGKEVNLEEYHEKHKHLISKLMFTSTGVGSIPGLGKIARELKERAERLGEKEFTVALFGAFSAGKSSFANALVGEKILPVSPNPTTAAINKIKPVTKDQPHGSARVKVKEKDILLEEVDRSLRLFGKEAADFIEALQMIGQIDWNESGFNPSEKTHYSFLQAFASGFGEFESQLGNILSADLESFREYVAQEEKSCFVEWIEVYFDCSLTREGITLVDTPGADSINARHTDVAFDYIKNSDAILFVTYYNHAFSKADREFLIQLGRVKDTFELDKMFFIVNAVDLADSEEEQQAVLGYVESQLVQYGIREPHIHPVSSLRGLQAKLDASSDPLFSQFEEAFYSFISSGLMSMAMEAAELKWHQAAGILEEMVHSAQEDKASKAEKKQRLLSDQEKMHGALSNKAAALLVSRVVSEADELTYYIRTRVFIRFGEFFRESFNPSLLKDDGRNLKKALESALEELIESIGFDLAQEMRATSLRIESFIERTMKEFQGTMIAELKQTHQSISLSPSESMHLTGIDFDTAFEKMDRGPFIKTLGMFKNPKSFFEKNEKKRMSDKLEELFQGPAEQYLKAENEKLKEHYSVEAEKAFHMIMEDFLEQIEEYFAGLSAALTDEFSIEYVKKTLEEIKNFR